MLFFKMFAPQSVQQIQLHPPGLKSGDRAQMGPYEGKYTKNMENEKMHKSMREQSSEFNFWTKRLQI